MLVAVLVWVAQKSHVYKGPGMPDCMANVKVEQGRRRR